MKAKGDDEVMEVLGFIFHTLIICMLYTGELFVITDLFMPHAKWRLKRSIGYGGILLALYSYLVYRYGISDDLWYVGLSAFVINNFLHDAKLKTRIWVFFIAYAISVGGEGIVCILLDQLYIAVGYEGTSWVLDDVIPHLSAFLVAVGVSSLLKKTPLYHEELESYNDLTKLKVMGLALIGIIYAVIFNTISIMYIYEENVHLASTMIFFGVYFTLFLVVLTVLRNYLSLKRQHSFREDGILCRIFEKHIDTYSHLEEVERKGESIKEEVEKEIESLIHLVGESESKVLMPYIENIKRYLYPRSMQVITGNEVVDAILHEKALRAKELGIDFEMNVSIPNTLKLNIVDLCIIVECTMDYIIDACDKGNKAAKKIKVKGVWFKGYLMFEIWYTLDIEEKIEMGYANLPHELGSVVKCLDKYGGDIEMTAEDHLRKVELNFNTMGGAIC